MGGPKSPDPETEARTTELAPIELETLARATAVGTTESEPIDVDRATIEIVPLVAIVDDVPAPDPAKLARGSEQVAPRTERPAGARRRRESLRVDEIAKKRRDDE